MRFALATTFGGWWRGLGALALALASVAACGGGGGGEASVDQNANEGAPFHGEAELADVAARAALVDEFLARCEPGKMATDRPFVTRERRVDPYEINYHVCRAPNERGALVVVPGTTESSIRYAEFAHDWLAQGYSLYIVNNRGEGFNERPLVDDPRTPDDESQRRHMVDFQDYVLDLEQFVRTVAAAEPHPSLHLVCHSMGGGICTRYAERFPDGPYDGLALSAPMHRIRLEGPALPKVAVITAAFLAGRGEQWVPNGTDYDPQEPFRKADGGFNTLTRSEGRFALRHFINGRFPEVSLGSSTFGWVHNALRATEELREQAGLVRKPVLLFSSLGDRIVDAAGHREVCDRINAANGPLCERVEIADAEHELFIERDEVRNAIFERMLTFFER
jgi:lysophospholipase